MGRYEQEFSPFLRAVRDDIFRLCQAMRFRPNHLQRALFEQVQREVHGPRGERRKRIAVKSGQGPGKTAASVVVSLYLLLQAKDTLGVLTAPSLRQCKDIWMQEAMRLMERADPMLRRIVDVRTTRIEICGRRTWGMVIATAIRAENLQGYHQTRLFFIVDEASGVKGEIFETIKGTVSNEDSLVLAIGNPNKRSCPFYDFFYKDRELWHCHTWNAEEVPERVSPSNIAKLEREYGRDSDYFRIRVLGEFPYADPNSILDADDVLACMSNDPIKVAARVDLTAVPRAISYDFARFGGDENVVMARSGLAVIDWKVFTRGTVDPSKAVRHGFAIQHTLGWADNDCWHIPDATGMGQGLMHLYHEAKKQVHEFVFNARPSKPDYKDKITEAWFCLRSLIRERAPYLPPDDELRRQLTSRVYFVDGRGKIVVESKEDYMGRGYEFSPDRADAAVLLFYDKMMGETRVSGRSSGGRGSRQLGSRLERR